MRRRSVLAAVCVAPFLASPAAAQGGGVGVSPVIIDIDPRRGVSSFRVRNGRGREAAFEIETWAWAQARGADVLTPTRALIAAPSVFATPAGGEQIVRLGLALGAGAGREQTFRLLMRELPSAQTPSGFQVLLEMSLPVFVSPADAAPRIEARLEHDDAGRSAIVVENRGEGHARLGAVEIDGASIQGPSYLLAGASFSRPASPSARAVRVRYGAGARGALIDETFALAAPAALADLR